MKVYLVSRSQGDYEENTQTDMAIWKYKADAESYVERSKKIFTKLHEFYSGIFYDGDIKHPLFNVAWDRSATYEPAFFYIKEFELR